MSEHSTAILRMIVNADDFGFFDGASRGIVELAQQGRVTATGVMANGPALPNWFEALRRLQSTHALSVGVHLNATLGQPLTNAMHRRLLTLGWPEFPGKGRLLSALLGKRIPLSILLAEWRAQIECCRNAGLQLSFINSHEHVHMLPGLYQAVRKLANEFGIRHVRAPSFEWPRPMSLAGLTRCAAFATIKMIIPRDDEPRLLGLASSGRLNEAYCQRCFAQLRANKTYELMCHPGHDDSLARAEPKLTAYHDWRGEQQWLSSVEFAQLLKLRNIELVSYQQL